MHEDVQEIAEIIDSTSWGSEFSWEELTEIARYMELVRRGKGRTIFKEGDTNNYLGLVVEGMVAVYKGATTEHDHRLTVVNKGKTFGEMSLLDSQPRSATVVASTDVTLLIMNEKNFKKLLKINPSLALPLVLKMAMLLSQRLRRTSNWLVDFDHD